MRSWAIALLPIFASASLDGDCSESDETLLLQTKAVTKATLKVTRGAPLHVHNFRIDAEESGVSLLQGHLEEQSTSVYFMESVNENALVEEEIDGHGAAIDHCGEVHVYNDGGEALFALTGCFPDSVPLGASFLFAENPDFEVADNSLVEVGLIEASDASDDVVLIAIPEMDEAKHLLAKEEFEKKMQEYPGASVLFTGVGAKHAHEHYTSRRWRSAHVSSGGSSSSVWCAQDERTMPSIRRRHGCR